MISFNQFLTEARMAPLYHATQIPRAEKILDAGGFLPLTHHWDFKLLKAPKGVGTRTYGISLTRNPRFARHWAQVVFEFDQQKLIQNYKLIPINYGVEMGYSRVKPDISSDFAGKTYENEYEEFVVSSKLIPLKYVKKIYLPKGGGDYHTEKLFQLANKAHQAGVYVEWQEASKLYGNLYKPKN